MVMWIQTHRDATKGVQPTTATQGPGVSHFGDRPKTRIARASQRYPRSSLGETQPSAIEGRPWREHHERTDSGVNGSGTSSAPARGNPPVDRAIVRRGSSEHGLYRGGVGT